MKCILKIWNGGDYSDSVETILAAGSREGCEAAKDKWEKWRTDFLASHGDGDDFERWDDIAGPFGFKVDGYEFSSLGEYKASVCEVCDADEELGTSEGEGLDECACGGCQDASEGGLCRACSDAGCRAGEPCRY